MTTPATERKRQQMQTLVERVLAPADATQAVLVIGSVANGLARPDSDIDAIVWFEPYDPYIVPAEFIWRPSDGSYRSIFADEADRDEDAQFDLHRLDRAVWARPGHVWPEGLLSELSSAWWAYCRAPEVAAWLQARIAYPDTLRRSRLDEALPFLDQHLAGDGPRRCWETLGPLVAHNRLLAALDRLVLALHVYHSRWLPWRGREIEHLLRLPWLPEGIEALLGVAQSPPGQGWDAYAARLAALREIFDALCQRLVSAGEYGEDIVSEAFVRGHDEPGRAWLERLTKA